MSGDERPITVELSYDEAYEILNRCLLAEGEDNHLFRAALLKLARAIESNQDQDSIVA